MPDSLPNDTPAFPPAPPPAAAGFDNRGLAAGTVVQAGGDAYSQSAIAGPGGAATVNNYTVHNVGSLPRRWLHPVPPPLPEYVVTRPRELAAVTALLRRQAGVAISGKVSSAGVQGMPGVGKTTLALLLAHDLAADYPDGVLWTDVGPDVKTTADCQRLLDQWAGYCVGPLDPVDLAHMQFDPAAVRSLLVSLLGERPRLLAVLDNVWSWAAVKPLREALPPGVHLLVTTRLQTVLDSFGSGAWSLDVLHPDDAAALVAEQLRWQPQAESDRAWVAALIEGLGRHPLALRVALGVLRRAGHYPAEWRQSAEEIVAAVRSGRDLAHLHLEETERESNIEAVLAISYDALPDDASRRQLRALGVFAPEAPFTTDHVAAVWGCDGETARRQLGAFANAALLKREDEQTWSQHALLRGYALAWLRAAGEYAGAAYSHAQVYSQAMAAAEAGGHNYTMRSYVPQLRHAFAWAIAANLDLAQDLVGSSFNLMPAFGLAREHADWCRQALAASQQRGDAARVVRAQISLGNALARLATLAGEDRRARLEAALAAYDEALIYLTPEAAPLAYAATQNNRGAILSDLATLAGEDRRARLYAALAAYDEALIYGTPAAAPLDHAMTQNNRGLLLSDLATLAGEDRRARLDAALAAYDQALIYRTPAAAPLAHAMTQNNRGAILSDLATLAGEDRRARLAEAVGVTWQALTLSVKYQHDQYAQECARTLKNLRIACGAEFAGLWQALGVGEPPAWLLEDDADAAGGYNDLGNSLDDAGDKAGALAAYERAVVLQPDVAMWRRNLASTLIDLCRLEEAEAALAAARGLEPDAARLGELEVQLAEARRAAEGTQNDRDPQGVIE